MIGQMLDGTGAMLALADSDGVLINVMGDKRTVFDGMDIHLGVGGKWTEDVVGTNGIGTALWTGEPVFRSRRRAFLRRYQELDLCRCADPGSL